MRAKKHAKKRKWLKVTGIIFLLILIVGGAYAYYVYHTLNKSVESMHDPIDREKSDKRTKDVKFTEKDPFSVLLLGVDERSNDAGRSDSLIVLTINPEQESVKMVSIPRDTLTEIVGKGYEDKINHAYAFGGVEMAMDTVENFLDIPIDYFVQVNMEGFEEIVNAVGGVTVNNDLAFSDGGFTFEEGQIELNGDEALAFARMRKKDPRGDFGRQLRQREVIQAIIKEGASVSSLWRFDNIFEALGNNVKTNLTFDEMVDIQKHYKAAAKDMEQIKIDGGSGQTIDGIWYYVVPEEEVQRIQSLLKEHMEI
ncbi:LytR family transcriptional regulator [Bacillus salacetis]|uniref:Polyisoprenyl-teichoic acid--peptidoglycan teichoic acid transferase TagU n=1 Tax=Bacillus salacetis TaxID=2315464 RepID=A0A3A1R1Y3_9BACI|nr:LytR family transcriptional regulator [Bacillus salacetis]RIW36067.1 LytR family transcriptional regulator [Bacillus salacetis]